MKALADQYSPKTAVPTERCDTERGNLDVQQEVERDIVGCRYVNNMRVLDMLAGD